MPIIGYIVDTVHGPLHEWHASTETITAPSADVSIPAAGTADITVSFAGGSPRPILHAGLASITGVPAGVYIASIAFNYDNRTLTITLYNSDPNAGVTVAANSLTLEILVIS